MNKRLVIIGAVSLLLVVLASGCTSSALEKAVHGGIVHGIESRDRNTVRVALWTLQSNGFDIPEIDFDGPYSEAEPKLKRLVDQVARLPAARLRKLDKSYRYHYTIYSPVFADGEWKDSLTSDVTATHDRSPYVKCVGRFTDYEAEYPWFENWVEQDETVVHDDGRCPRATFCLSAPAVHAGRMVGVLYKYEGEDRPTPPPLSQKGKDFSFELPEDFFTGKHVTIDNVDVTNFKVMP
jgi:hypothetical protein